MGHCFDSGTGTQPNREAALYWCKRAFHGGDANAAHNIGIIWRDEDKAKKALSWFVRVVELGDDSSNLEIAKHYPMTKEIRRRQPST